MKQEYADLHTHTTYSDGLDTPELLVKTARLRSLNAVAITDHDIITGYYSAIEAGKRWGIQVIPGVEFSAGKYHILGLNVDPENYELKGVLRDAYDCQEKKTKKRIKMLNDAGIPITYDKVRALYPYSRLGKINLLAAMTFDPECQRALQQKHPNAAQSEIFGLYLDTKTGIAGRSGIDDSVSDDSIPYYVHKAGGIAILAHPFKDVDDMSEIERLVKYKLDGIEVQPRYKEKNKPFIDFAEKHGLIITYGSDYHGSCWNRPMLERGENLFDLELLMKYR